MSLSMELLKKDLMSLRGQSWYDLTLQEEAVDEIVQNGGILDSNLDSLQKFFMLPTTYPPEEAEYQFSPSYREYRKNVTQRELDAQLDSLRGKKENLIKGAGCVFYNISEQARLSILFCQDTQNESPFLCDLGGEFLSSDSCAFSCAKRNVEAISGGQLTLDGTEELCDDSITTPYFIYFREIEKIEPPRNPKFKLGWYNPSSMLKKYLHPRVKFSLIERLVKRANSLKNK